MKSFTNTQTFYSTNLINFICFLSIPAASAPYIDTLLPSSVFNPLANNQ